MLSNFKDLDIWKRAILLVKTIYKITKKLPKDEQYGLISQIRRASVSVPSNIAEGFKRRSDKEFAQFLNISLGSLAELETQIIISCELDYIKEKESDAIIEEIESINRMISKLYKKLKSKK